MAKSTNDPFVINPDEAKNIKSGLKNTSAGVICPKLNKQIGEKCFACDSIQPLWSFPKNSSERDLAVEKKAKVNFYMNVVFSNELNKSYILEIGKTAGNDVIEGIEKKGWTDIAHPKAGKGRELTITKGQNSRGYNSYSVSPVLEKADWDISDEVLDNLPNLDNIIDMIRNNEFTDDNFVRISDIKMGDTLKFRMCPPAKEAVYFRFLAYVWRHWGGVTEAEVRGEEEIDLTVKDDVEEDTQEQASDNTPWEEKVESKDREDNIQKKKEPCFGKPDFFDATDDDCRNCKDFKECKKACKHNL